MYKYKCIAAANADKEDFYGVIGGLKGLYPEMFENNNAPSDNEFLRREFFHGQNRVMVQYSFSERSVTVFSEDWLGKFYEDREVAEGRFPAHSSVSTYAMWKISSAFFAVTAVASFFVVGHLFSGNDTPLTVMVIVLAAVYTVSGIMIKRRTDIPLLKLSFCQAGGFISVIIGLITANFYLLGMYLHSLIIGWVAASLVTLPTMYIMSWFTVCLPAVEISFIIQAIVGLVMKKVHSSKTAAEENIAETDNVNQ